MSGCRRLLNVALGSLYIHEKGVGNRKEKGEGGWQWKQGVGNRVKTG